MVLQHAHSHTAVPVSCKETVLHAQNLSKIQAYMHRKFCAYITVNTNARSISTMIEFDSVVYNRLIQKVKVQFCF